MISKINKISNYRIFKNWSNSDRNIDFKRVNLIYGLNGSGKSTLVNLLNEAKTDKAWSAGLEIVHSTENGELIQQSFDSELLANIQIFNKQFIDENIAFSNNEGPFANSLVTIGKEPIELIKDKKSTIEQIASLEEKIRENLEDSRNIEEIKNKLISEFARNMRNRFSRLGRKFTSMSYDASLVKKMLETEQKKLSDAEYQEHLIMTNQKNINHQVLPALTQIVNVTEFQEYLDHLLTEDKERTYSFLGLNIGEIDWIKIGNHLHQSREFCLYCRNQITDERKTELNSIFDTNTKLFIDKISACLNILQIKKKSAESFFQDLPKEEFLADNLKNNYSLLINEIKNYLIQISEIIDILIINFENKLKNPFASINLNIILPNYPTTYVEKLIEIVDVNNAKAAKLEEEIYASALAIESSELVDLKISDDSHKISLKNLTEERTVFNEQLEKLNFKLNEIEASEFASDNLRIELNAEVRSLTGNNDLKFEYQEKGKYRIMRGEEPAHNLSEGERTALAFIYFLKRLKSGEITKLPFIAIIDDPIASLDSGIIHGVSAHTWTDLVMQKEMCEQLFVLTHNFEFFRLILNSLISIKKKLRSKIIGDFAILELRKSYSNNARSDVVINDLSNSELDFSKFRSEYVFYFWRLANDYVAYCEKPTILTEIDAEATLPNLCRKLLEGFMAFKCPEEIGNFRKQCERVLEPVIENVNRIKLTMFLNAFSHHEESDVSAQIATNEVLPILKMIFEAMREIDSTHYDSMVVTIGLDPLA